MPTRSIHALSPTSTAPPTPWSPLISYEASNGSASLSRPARGAQTTFGTNASSHARFFSEKADDEAKKEEPEADEAAGSKTETASAEGSANGEEQEAAEEGPPPSREEQLEAEVKNLKDQLLRGLAEQENTRRIAQRDMESAKQFAIKSFAKSLLDVSDNLTRALESVPEDARADKDGNPVLANLYEGIQMTDKGLEKAFEMNGLIKYGKVGEKFDPNTHEALFEYEDPDKEAGTIGQVMKSGFVLNKRVLRPAEVGVVKKG